MDKLTEGFYYLIVGIVALVALAGVVLIRTSLRYVVALVGILVVLYMLGYLPPISLP